MELLPEFVPGREKNKPLRVRRTITIPFVLPEVEDVSKKEAGSMTKSEKTPKSTYLKRDLARDRINRLKEGVLVVKLIVPDKKLFMLQQLTTKASSAKKRQEYQEQLNALKASTDKENRALIQFFNNKDYYSFSDVVFIYEKEAKKGNLEQSNKFLNSSLEVDPAISIKGRQYFTTQVGSTPRNEDSRTVYKAFVTRAPEGGVLSHPFPTYITWINKNQKGNSKFRFNGILKSDLEVSDAVTKFNNVMKHFYLKANEWE